MQRLTLDSCDLAGLAESVLQNDGSLTFAARGTSMQPTIRDGDSLTVSRIEPDSISQGDILLYRTGDGTATVHRVRSPQDGGIAMSCDARPWTTYVIPREWVLGRITAAARGGRPLELGGSLTAGFRLRLRFILRTAGSWASRWIGSVMGFFTRFRPVRRCYSIIIGWFVKYSHVPRKDPGELSDHEIAWDQVQATVADRAVGSAQLVVFSPGNPYSKYQWLFSMRVSRPFRGAGIGRELTRMIIELASETPDRDLCLTVMRDNDRAVELYRSMGFIELAETEVPDGIRDRLGTDKLIMVYRM